ncbi:MAG: Crp/Fnr family transcriptional regulator [Xanthobacteraceae bacterium]|nr:Crp/Fnr family transcriptional regulator [Xanthobacteraceae bacterium]MCW5675462.1 Crp/Fnr family transcriptional regulator [Xanthobacteraceae bacterium]
MGSFYAPIPESWKDHPFVKRLSQYMDLGSADYESLWRVIEGETKVEKRKDLVVDGYGYRKLCFVEDGFAARYKLLRNGKRQIINLILPGDVIGLPGSFLERARYSVIALSPLKLHICPINSYVQLCYQKPQFGLALSWLAVQEMILGAEHTISTGRRNPEERVAHFLLELYSRLKIVGRAVNSRLELPASQEIISDALGLSVPHFNRTLAKLRTDGLIATKGRQIEFIDHPALELLGNYQPLNLTRIPSPHFAATN